MRRNSIRNEQYCHGVTVNYRNDSPDWMVRLNFKYHLSKEFESHLSCCGHNSSINNGVDKTVRFHTSIRWPRKYAASLRRANEHALAAPAHVPPRYISMAYAHTKM